MTIFLITDVLKRIGGKRKKKKKNEDRNRDVSPARPSPLCHRRPLRRVETQRRPGQ